MSSVEGGLVWVFTFMSRNLLGELMEESERSFGLQEARIALLLDLEQYAEKYFDMSLEELALIKTFALDRGDPQESKVLRKIQLREEPKDAFVDLRRDLKTAYTILQEATRLLDEDENGRALRCLIDAAQFVGRVAAYERIENFASITKKRSAKNRSNAVSKKNSELKSYIVIKIERLPLEQKKSLSMALKQLGPEIEKYASSIGVEPSWGDDSLVRERLKDWRKRDPEFKERIDAALRKEMPSNLLPS
ncbi:hypothetical protein [Ottowia beijingensis]